MASEGSIGCCFYSFIAHSLFALFKFIVDHLSTKIKPAVKHSFPGKSNLKLCQSCGFVVFIHRFLVFYFNGFSFTLVDCNYLKLRVICIDYIRFSTLTQKTPGVLMWLGHPFFQNPSKKKKFGV
jgi:hypothetical protein